MSIVHLYNTLVLLLSTLLINAHDLVYNEIYSADIIVCIFNSFVIQVFRSEGYMTQYKDKSKNDVSQDGSEKPFKFR